MDLTWTTVGTPYAYRITTRYEIPCTITGTVTIDGRTYQIRGGPRAARPLPRRARLVEHGLGLECAAPRGRDASARCRYPHPRDGPVSVGYLQRAGEPVTETTAVTADATFADNGLPLTTSIVYEPGPVETTVDIRGHAPVRLVGPEGQISQFPRAWVTVETADGRSGVGWVEWNRNL